MTRFNKNLPTTEEKTLKQNVQSNIYSEISKVKPKIVQMQTGEEDLNLFREPCQRIILSVITA